jgi:hypothetical protein
MQWTCQTDGPLWWGIQNSEKWYQYDTTPQELVEDYLRAHPQDQGKTLVLTWWKSWDRIGHRVQIDPQQELVSVQPQESVETLLL